ncbi:MAG TPA: signal peptidase I [Pirellulaceae bacterium]|nr:signal peptidase I [Pirellulaceae bacterium]
MDPFPVEQQKARILGRVEVASMLTFGAIAAFLAIAALVQVVTIWIAAVVVRVKEARFARAAGTYVLQTLVYVTAGLLAISTYYIPTSIFPRGAWLVVLSIFGLGSVIGWVAIARYVLRSGWWQAIGVYVAQTVAGGGMAVVFRLIVEGFLIPTNAMAPTIVGHRYVGTCPQCQGNVIVTASDIRDRDRYGLPTAGICDMCWQSQDAELDLTRRYAGDRILASKVEQPHRWDAVVYDSPAAPGQKWIHRLVGLPGEHVAIRDGSLWINGERHSLPAGLEKLRYRSSAELGMGVADETAQWQLDDDEFFVLGDNTESSMDSRYFGPVRKSQLHSVAIATYWPPDRMRLLRPDR